MFIFDFSFNLRMKMELKILLLITFVTKQAWAQGKTSGFQHIGNYSKFFGNILIILLFICFNLRRC